MIHVFIEGDAPSYEEVGAIELLRALGQKITAIIPSSSDTGALYSARAALSQFGVDVEAYQPGRLSKAPVVLNFGHKQLFEIAAAYSDKPKRVVYFPRFVSPQDFEISALASGFIDEVATKSPKYAVAYVRSLVREANRGVEHRHGYVPFCNPDSKYCGLEFTPKSEQQPFVVLKDVEDDAEFSFPDCWRMLVGVTAPKGRRVEFKVAGFGEISSEIFGDPLSEDSKWRGEFNVELFAAPLSIPEDSDMYRGASVLLHYFPMQEAFSFASAKAMLCGAVVVAGPTGAHTDLITHGETGLLVTSADEAAYLASRLAWEPHYRAKIASNAYNWFVAHGPGNPDIAMPWWKELLQWL